MAGCLLCGRGGMCERGNGEGEEKKQGRGGKEGGRREAGGSGSRGRGEERGEGNLVCSIKEHELQNQTGSVL